MTLEQKFFELECLRLNLHAWIRLSFSNLRNPMPHKQINIEWLNDYFK